jgi:hypothetical protein
MTDLNRRTVLAAGLSMLCSPSLAQPAPPPVKYLLVRKAGLSNQCVRCIPGRLFGVPAGLDLATVQPNNPLLRLLADTIELSYEDNQQNVSSIPLRTYDARVRRDGTKKWMWSGNAIGSGTLDLDRAWRVELENVPHRTAIQFHFGQDVGWSNGCVMIGSQPANQCTDACRFANSPATGTRAMRAFFEATAVDANNPILVRLMEA